MEKRIWPVGILSEKCIKKTAFSLSALPLYYQQSFSSREHLQCPSCCWGSWGCFPRWCWGAQRWPWCSTGHLKVSSLDLSPTSRTDSYKAWEGSPQWPGGHKWRLNVWMTEGDDERRDRQEQVTVLYLEPKVPGGIINIWCARMMCTCDVHIKMYITHWILQFPHYTSTAYTLVNFCGYKQCSGLYTFKYSTIPSDLWHVTVASTRLWDIIDIFQQSVKTRHLWTHLLHCVRHTED